MEPAQIGFWFELMAPGLVLYARQIAGGGSAAEDVVQEVFLRLAAQAQSPENVKAWLLLAVRRAALDCRKTTRRRATRDRAAGLARHMFEPPPHDGLPAAEAQEALASLALEEREIITLRIWNDSTFEEIAGIMGMPISTVYHRYRSALDTLRARLELPCPKK